MNVQLYICPSMSLNTIAYTNVASFQGSPLWLYTHRQRNENAREEGTKDMESLVNITHAYPSVDVCISVKTPTIVCVCVCVCVCAYARVRVHV